MGPPSGEPNEGEARRDVAPHVTDEPANDRDGSISGDGYLSSAEVVGSDPRLPANEALSARLLSATERALRLQERIIEQGHRLLAKLERSSTLKPLREVGALTLLQASYKASSAVIDAQLRVDEAALRACGEGAAIAELLRRVAAHDRAKVG
jgi:hypothetical protein